MKSCDEHATTHNLKRELEKRVAESCVNIPHLDNTLNRVALWWIGNLYRVYLASLGLAPAFPLYRNKWAA